MRRRLYLLIAHAKLLHVLAVLIVILGVVLTGFLDCRLEVFEIGLC